MNFKISLLIKSLKFGVFSCFIGQLFAPKNSHSERLKLENGVLVSNFDPSAPGVKGKTLKGAFSKFNPAQSPGAQLHKFLTANSLEQLSDQQKIQILPDQNFTLGKKGSSICVETVKNLREKAFVVIDDQKMTKEKFINCLWKNALCEIEGSVCHAQPIVIFIEQGKKGNYKLKKGPLDKQTPSVMLSVSAFTKDFVQEDADILSKVTLSAAKKIGAEFIAFPPIGLGVFRSSDEKINQERARMYFRAIARELKIKDKYNFKTVYLNPGQYMPQLEEIIEAQNEQTNLIPTYVDVFLLTAELGKNDQICAIVNPSNTTVLSGIALIGHTFLYNIGPAEQFFAAFSTAVLGSYKFWQSSWTNPITINQALAFPPIKLRS